MLKQHEALLDKLAAIEDDAMALYATGKAKIPAIIYAIRMAKNDIAARVKALRAADKSAKPARSRWRKGEAQDGVED